MPSSAPRRHVQNALRANPLRIAAVAFCLFLGACQVELYRGLSQREANEMVAVLARAGIEAKREEADPTTFRVMVAEADLPSAVDALERAGLPAERFQSLAEIFPGDGLIVSPYEQRIRTMHALNQEIARSITTIAGVRSARVHIVLPELDLRGQPMNRPSASVMIHHADDLDAEDLASRVRLLVANAVQGMNFRDVAVAFFHAGAADAGMAPAPTQAEQTQRPPAAAPPADAPALAAPASEAEAPAGGVARYVFWFAALAAAAGAGILALRDHLRRRRRVETTG